MHSCHARHRWQRGIESEVALTRPRRAAPVDSSTTAERSHPADAEKFYHDVAHALDGVEEIPVTGPASAKLEFIKYVHKSHHTLVPKIVGVETVDHPTDKQLVAYARHYFRAADKVR